MSISNVTLIGLTGMSGAGKSTACRLFRENGYEIVDCDKLSRVIVQKGKPCLKEIAGKFGAEALTTDGELNRSKVASIVFGDEKKRLLLNGIMYPYITYIIIDSAFSRSEKCSFLLDAPTLFESGINELCDVIVSVVAERDLSVERICRRDGISEADATKRLSSQHDKGFYIKHSDFYAENNGSIDDFERRILEIIRAVGRNT